jgi:hypothetical protein
MSHVAHATLQLAMKCIDESPIPISVISANGVVNIVNRGQIERQVVMVLAGRAKVLNPDGDLLYPTNTKDYEINTGVNVTTSKLTKAVVRAESIVRMVKHQTVTKEKRKDGYDRISIRVPNVLVQGHCVLCGDACSEHDMVTKKTRVSHMWTAESLHRRCVIPCLINGQHYLSPFLYNMPSETAPLNYCELCEFYAKPAAPVVDAFKRMKTATQPRTDVVAKSQKLRSHVVEPELYRDPVACTMYLRHYYPSKPIHTQREIFYDEQRRLYYRKEYLPYTDY